MIICNLEKILEKRNTSINALSLFSDISRATLTSLAKGSAKGVHLDTLNRLCFVLDIKLSELLSYASFDFCIKNIAVDNNALLKNPPSSQDLTNPNTILLGEIKLHFQIPNEDLPITDDIFISLHFLYSEHKEKQHLSFSWPNTKDAITYQKIISIADDNIREYILLQILNKTEDFLFKNYQIEIMQITINTTDLDGLFPSNIPSQNLFKLLDLYTQDK